MIVADKTADVYIDGGSRGNPGPASIALILIQPGEADHEEGQFIGEATNNVAEYRALILALERALELQLQQLRVHSDSELLVKQINGQYKVKNQELKQLHAEAQRLIAKLDSFSIQHVPREQNSRADRLCNQVLDRETPKKNKAPLPSVPEHKESRQTVFEDCLQSLTMAALSWSRSGELNPPVEDVWNQLVSLLEDGGLLSRKK